MSKEKKTVWLAGGGTGGHISPAISVYEQFKDLKQYPVILTLERNQDYPPIQNLNEKDDQIIFYRASPIPKSLKSLLLFYKDIMYTFHILNNESRSKKPEAILAFGGYPVFPVLLWAWLHRIPYFMHEQNAYHGMITRLFKIKAQKVFLSFPKGKYSSRELLTGNPLRKIFLKHKKNNKKTGSKFTVKNILLLGGSQGARDINNLYSKMISRSDFQKYQFTISTGKTDFEQMKISARKKDNVYSFIEDVPSALIENDVIISRSGSGMVFEILWSGKPAFFIPYPYAASNHQKYNSLALSVSNQYRTFDTRPFQPDQAADSLVEFIQKLEEEGNIVANDLTIPLNAHQVITETILHHL